MCEMSMALSSQMAGYEDKNVREVHTTKVKTITERSQSMQVLVEKSKNIPLRSEQNERKAERQSSLVFNFHNCLVNIMNKLTNLSLTTVILNVLFYIIVLFSLFFCFSLLLIILIMFSVFSICYSFNKNFVDCNLLLIK